jgi:hypothetical protein
MFFLLLPRKSAPSIQGKLGGSVGRACTNLIGVNFYLTFNFYSVHEDANTSSRLS